MFRVFSARNIALIFVILSYASASGSNASGSGVKRATTFAIRSNLNLDTFGIMLSYLSPDDPGFEFLISESGTMRNFAFEHFLNFCTESSETKRIIKDLELIDKEALTAQDFKSLANSCGNIFLWAAESGQIVLLEYLLSTGDKTTAEKGFAFVAAAANGKNASLSVLLEYGASVQFLNGAALLVAAQNGHKETVEYLISQPNGFLNSHHALSLALPKCHLEVVKILVTLNGRQISSLYEPLIYAIKYGCVDVVEYLLSVGVGSMSRNFENRLPSAILTSGNIGILKVFFERKPDIELRFDAHEVKRALENGHHELVNEIISLDIYGPKIETHILETDIKFNNIQLVKALFSRGVRLNYDSTVFLEAIKAGLVDIVKFLLDNDSQIRILNDPEWILAINEHPNMTEMIMSRPGIDKSFDVNSPLYQLTLLAKGGDIDGIETLINEPTRFELIPKLHAVTWIKAAEKGDPNILAFLESYGLKLNTSRVIEEALNQAAERGHLNVIEHIFREYQFDASLRHGALNKAARRGDLEIVKYLVSKGVNARMVVLDEIIALNHVKVFKYFVDIMTSRNLNIPHSTIDVAAQLGRLEIVKYLAEKFGIRGGNNMLLSGAIEDVHRQLMMVALKDHNITEIKDERIQVVKYLIELGCANNADVPNSVLLAARYSATSEVAAMWLRKFKFTDRGHLLRS